MSTGGIGRERVWQNLEAVRRRLAAACARSGRDPASVRIVAVTKGFPAEVAVAAVQAGVTDLGENYVQEAREKVRAVPEATWHLVGHLQRNKAREAVRLFPWIHSVDSVPLAEELDRRAAKHDRTIQVLIQVNVAGEAQKHGVPPEEVIRLAQTVQRLSGLRLRGLMTIAPLSSHPEGIRWVFRTLRALRDDLAYRLGSPLPELSMGMTDDFEVAVEEGATLVRLGRALFGERPEKG
ncbi:MAG: YggS family pyridoxal phosphate-dependent enzyme [Armatimonadota bacterium]|nr:YggS family pyridoxal phosphate-dependent enzyme [Armatimonadota bacterium]MDR7439089.1 YggS family pyridoxal phosphate-dependent enzyme [Armatimonadota bacterium]MDR7563518.1 YggS family pyridoxal phosphate-dependent enzyme [Armatimonadota bacterium]MDR7568601.1 YggS family pyridoxal phosphate-dependent enzyme [Armatimonadota bacterium]MDR7602694.1 YggS family pyridoxal phosphate-dependent enzyme [Armatimonadota bacterium]